MSERERERERERVVCVVCVCVCVRERESVCKLGKRQCIMFCQKYFVINVLLLLISNIGKNFIEVEFFLVSAFFFPLQFP